MAGVGHGHENSGPCAAEGATATTITAMTITTKRRVQVGLGATCIMDTKQQPSCVLASFPTSYMSRRLPSPGPAFNYSNPSVGPFHRLCPAPHAAPRLGHLCHALPPPASEGSGNGTYTNKSLCIVSQGMFTLREINQME
ncbi:hypothetical protein BC826DRAFT_1121209 [Russula brevipes]|nr:hypothetical protein BC826DRAFT_1121209 [Russula brevipes]